MRYIAIIVIIVLAITIWFRRRLIVARGYIYCDLCLDALKIYDATLSIDKDAEERTHVQIISGKRIAIEYDATNRGTFFYEMEVIIAEIEKRYGKIKNNEFNFQEDDWNTIQDYRNRMKDLANHISYLEWQEGFRKMG